MFDRNHNSNGDHAAGLLDYMYGEMDSPARDAFESHLAGCDDCAIELAAVSDARLGVVEWRRNDFEHLATPEIVISELRPTGFVADIEKTGVFTSLFESLTSLPLFAGVGVGLAAAALLFGVIYFGGYLRSNQRDVAGNPNKNVEAPVVFTEPKPSRSDREPPAIKDTDPTGPTNVERTSARITASSKPVVTHRTGFAIFGHAQRKPAAETAVKTGTRQSPRLNMFDEDEDKTLRLADLFADIGRDGF